MVGAAPTQDRPRRRGIAAAAALLASTLVLAGTAGAATPDTTPPSTPVVTVAFTTQATIMLTWSASTDNVGVTGYRLFRNGTQVAAVSTRAYAFSGLTCGTSYTLGVAAIDAVQNQSKPATVSSTTQACGTSSSTSSTPPTTAPPSTPTGPTSSGSPVPSGPVSGALAVSPSGSDKNPCTQAAPCASFDRAYHAAQPGQTVQVAAGTYGAQTITPDPAQTGANVVFNPTGSVTVAKLAIGGNHLTFQNMTAVWKMLPTANTITLHNIISPGAIYITGGADNITITGGQVYSPVPVYTDSQIASLYGKVPTNIDFDGVAFHDFRDIGPGNLHHIECLQIGGAINLTIQNSTFQNCETHDIFIRSWGTTVNNSPYPLSNILIQNNTLAPTLTGYYSMQILDDLWTGQPPTSVTINHNTFQQGIHINVTHGTTLITNNTLPAMSAYLCTAFGPNTTLTGNTYLYGTPCGTNSTVTNPATTTTTTTTTGGSSTTKPRSTRLLPS